MIVNEEKGIVVIESGDEIERHEVSTVSYTTAYAGEPEERVDPMFETVEELDMVATVEVDGEFKEVDLFYDVDGEHAEPGQIVGRL